MQTYSWNNGGINFIPLSRKWAMYLKDLNEEIKILVIAKTINKEFIGFD